MAKASGRLSKDEIAYIKEHYEKLSVKMMAEELGRTTEVIRSYVEKFQMNVDGFDIKQRPFWGELQQQFSSTELKSIVYYWTKLIEQFKDDVVAAEELQILDLARAEMLISRNLKDKRSTQVDEARLRKSIQQAYQQDPPDIDAIARLEEQLGFVKNSSRSKTEEYVKLLDKKNALYKQLKVTRDQRIERVQSNKTTFMGYMTELEREEARNRESESITLMKLATENEKERMSQSHQYIDDEYDIPILNAETVILKDENE